MPRLVRRVLLPVSFAFFFTSVVVSSLFYYSGKPFDLKDAVVSDLESPDDNPHGYGVAAAGTAVCGILLASAAALFYRRLRVVDRKLALLGAPLSAAGLAAAIAIGCLAPFTRDYTPLHLQLAFAAFFGICSGTTICLVVAARPALQAGGYWGPAMAAMAAAEGGVLLSYS